MCLLPLHASTNLDDYDLEKDIDYVLSRFLSRCNHDALKRKIDVIFYGEIVLRLKSDKLISPAIAHESRSCNLFKSLSGSSGADMQEWVQIMCKNFSYPHIKVMYPTAPLQPYTPAGGQRSKVWFDRADVSIHVPEKLDSLANIENEVMNLIQTEVKSGVPLNRIIVGGFSMGGALALHTAYRWSPHVAGVFAFSSFLNHNSAVYKKLENSPDTLAPLLQIHGDSDDLVPLEWAETTSQELKSRGVKGELHIMKGLGHSINKKGTNIIRDWIHKLLPEV